MSGVHSTAGVSRRSQGLTPPEQTVRYHQETKHQFMRYARSLGFLDWANQPDPFRRYAGAPLYSLPLLSPSVDGTPLYDDLYVPGRIGPHSLTIESLSRFLEYALSITAWKQAGDVRWALRSNPSSGNLHPTEGYVLIRPMTGLADRAGLYHYAPKEHGLELRAVPDDWAAADLFEPFPPDSFFFGLTSVHWREAWKYGERAFRYCHHDVGHAIGSARLSAASLGWRMLLLSGLSSDQLTALLGVGRSEDYRNGEREHADCLAVVFPDPSRLRGREALVPRTLPPRCMDAMARCRWQGEANRLSPDEPLRWDIIDEVAEATVWPGGSDEPICFGEPPPPRADDSPRPLGVHRIVHQRRSAVAFDGKTSLTADQFYRMLSRVMVSTDNGPAAQLPPWDVGLLPPRVHLVIFVHLVEGVIPGLYCLVRHPDALPLLKAKMNGAFDWIAPPGCPSTVPLYGLAAGDARRVAAQLSCHQDIAGASAFSLGMLAEFEGPLQQEGAQVYPRLFWECGLIGQVLYLEAEAAGVRATGIGCFFDDPVHELLGLTDLTLQSLYHFTVGGPVEDTRLTTLPPYEHLRRE